MHEQRDRFTTGRVPGMKRPKIRPDQTLFLDVVSPDQLKIGPPGILFEAFKGKMEFCQNPVCPNNHFIAVMAFRGTGACSDNCRKAIGKAPPEVDARH